MLGLIKYQFLQQQAKVRMTKEKGSDKSESFWGNVWGKREDYQSSGTLKALLPMFIDLIASPSFSLLNTQFSLRA